MSSEAGSAHYWPHDSREDPIYSASPFAGGFSEPHRLKGWKSQTGVLTQFPLILGEDITLGVSVSHLKEKLLEEMTGPSDSGPLWL